MSNMSKVANCFTLQDGFQGSTMIHDELFPVFLLACPDARVYGNTRKHGHLL